jgi:23S rRNA (pseudouridine1915-N3)-methyltransferase
LRLSVIAVGRLKAGPEKSLADEYRERAEGLGRKAGFARITVSEFAESPQATAAARMAEEARQIAAALPPRAFVIVLDERGKPLSTDALVEVVRKQRDEGLADLAVVIGGPDGLAPEIRARASLLLSFGALTWPHRLVRVMLFEQIYRLVTIMVNHPYHRP